MKYLIEITRDVRAERPSESQIYLDSVALVEGRQVDVVQDKLKDCYFMFSGKAEIELIRMEAVKNFHDFTNKAGDGMRVLEYRAATGRSTSRSRVIAAYEDMDGQQVAEQTINESFEVHHDAGIEYKDTRDEAETFIASLGASVGYYLVGEFENDSEVLKSRPSLVHSEDNSYVMKLANLHGRTDGDRY